MVRAKLGKDAIMKWERFRRHKKGRKGSASGKAVYRSLGN